MIRKAIKVKALFILGCSLAFLFVVVFDKNELASLPDAVKHEEQTTSQVKKLKSTAALQLSVAAAALPFNEAVFENLVKDVNTLRLLLSTVRERQDDHSEAMAEMIDALRNYKNKHGYEKYRQLLKAQFKSIKQNKMIEKKPSEYVIMDDVNIDFNIRYRLVIMVTTNAPNFARRQTIRKLWGNATVWKTREPFKVIFVVGGTFFRPAVEKIHDESQAYHDIILESIPESFYTLSNKLAISLHWISQSNAKFDYVMKCDDDVFVQIDHMMSTLASPELKQISYFGNKLGHQPVLRKGRYKLSREERPKDHYDPYCSGGGFVLKSSLLEKIAPHLDFVNPMKYEDAYLGSVVFKYARGNKPYHHKGFHMVNKKCAYDENLIVSHPAHNISCMNKLFTLSMDENKHIKYKDRTESRV